MKKGDRSRTKHNRVKNNKTLNNRSKIREKNSRKNNNSVKKGLPYRLLVLFSITLIILIITECIILLIGNSYHNISEIYNEDYGELGSRGVFKIQNPVPNGSIVSFFVGENRTFSIANNNYESLNWYLDGKNLKNNTKSIRITGLPKGNHTLEVSIKNSSETDSKIWKIFVEDNIIERKFIFDTGYVLFWLIIAIIIIVMILLVWLVIEETIRKKRRIKLEMKVISGTDSGPEFIRKRDMSKRFNLPR